MELLLNLWHIPLLKWAVILLAALAIAYVLWAKVNRWAGRDNRVTTLEKVIVFPFALVAAVLSWTVNWLIAPFVWRESGLPFLKSLWQARPHKWNETFSLRLKRTLANPQLYPPRAVYVAGTLKPWLNRRDPGHI